MAGPQDLAKQYNDAMAMLLNQFHKTLNTYLNKLIAETADADRLVVLEEIGGTAAGGGMISLTSKIVQPTIITGILINFDVAKDVILTVGRYSQDVNNAQSRVQIISPVQYFVGPGDKITLTWASGVTPTQIPYFAVFGKLVGSHFGG